MSATVYSLFSMPAYHLGVPLPGTIAIIDASPIELNSRKPAPSTLKFKVSIDGTVKSKTVGPPSKVQVDPGMHKVQVSIAGWRTNAVNVSVVEGGRHVVRVTRRDRTVAVYFGLIGALIAVAKPGLAWSAEHSQT